MRRFTVFSFTVLITLFQGFSNVAQASEAEMRVQLALDMDKVPLSKDQTLWSEIKVDPKSGVVTANKNLWTEQRANLYVSNDRKDIFYLTRNSGEKSVRRTIELKNYGIIYSDRYDKGTLAAKTFCVGDMDCISVNAEFCSKMLKLMKMESPKKLIAKVSECERMNSDKALAWQALSELTRAENSDLQKTLRNSMVMETFKGIKITRSPQMHDIQESVDALSFKGLRMCDDAFWSRGTQAGKAYDKTAKDKK